MFSLLKKRKKRVTLPKHLTLPSTRASHLRTQYISEQETVTTPTILLPVQGCAHPGRQQNHRYCAFCGYPYTTRN